MISVVCPVFQEAKFIEEVLRFFVEATPEEKELFVVDGGSTDGTIEIVNQYVAKYSNITLLHNPNKIVPYALNMAIRQAKGQIIVRLDAHTIYAPDYFKNILKTFEKTGADIVGGPMNPKGKTPIQKAIAWATKQQFAIGNSHFHNLEYEGWVDSVYLGAWKKEIFTEVGYFDEEMVRNQDDEFHYRAKSKGKRIYLSPSIKSTYYPRDSYKKLFSQYYQYGLYKPKVIRKVQSEVKLRHLVPLFFVVYLLSLPILGWIWYFELPLLAYVLATFMVVLNAKNHDLDTNKIWVLPVFFIIHTSYGLGFLRGIFLSK